jgi:tetratricopeptide (TPR) repeat protein
VEACESNKKVQAHPPVSGKRKLTLSVYAKAYHLSAPVKALTKYWMNKKLLLLIYLGFCLPGCKPGTNTDFSPEDTESEQSRFERLEADFERTNYIADSAAYYSQRLSALARETGSSAYLARATHYKGITFLNMAQYDSAEAALLQSIEGYQALGDSLRWSNALNNLGTTYTFQSRFAASLDMHKEAARIKEAIGDRQGLGQVYNNIANLVTGNQLYAQALEYYQKAIDIAIETDNPRAELPPRLNRSLVYLEERDYEKALESGKEIKEKSAAYNVPYGVAKGTYVLGRAYMALGDVDKAEQEIDLGISLFESMGNIELYSMKLLKADVLSHKKAYKPALKLTDELLQVEGLNEGLIENLYKLRYDIYKSQNNEKGALGALERYHAQYKKLSDKTLEDQVARLQTAFDTEVKNREIKRLKEASLEADTQMRQRTYWLVIILVVTITGAIMAFLIVQHLRSKAARALTDVENKLLRSQLNPHFIFNAMAAIQDYIYSRKDPRIIADYLARFSGLTRMILNYSKREFISLKEELDFLGHYVKLQQIRFEVPFHFELQIDPELQQQDILIPPMLTQPFIENAIEHGLLHRKDKGQITLSIEEKEGQIHMTVEDDGIGRKQAAAIKKRTSHQSMATQITRDRLSLLQKRLKRKTKFHITDLFDNQRLAMGTRVSLQLPIIRA